MRTSCTITILLVFLFFQGILAQGVTYAQATFWDKVPNCGGIPSTIVHTIHNQCFNGSFTALGSGGVTTVYYEFANCTGATISTSVTPQFRCQNVTEGVTQTVVQPIPPDYPNFGRIYAQSIFSLSSKVLLYKRIVSAAKCILHNGTYTRYGCNETYVTVYKSKSANCDLEAEEITEFPLATNCTTLAYNSDYCEQYDCIKLDAPYTTTTTTTNVPSTSTTGVASSTTNEETQTGAGSLLSPSSIFTAFTFTLFALTALLCW